MDKVNILLDAVILMLGIALVCSLAFCSTDPYCVISSIGTAIGISIALIGAAMMMVEANR